MINNPRRLYHVGPTAEPIPYPIAADPAEEPKISSDVDLRDFGIYYSDGPEPRAVAAPSFGERIKSVAGAVHTGAKSAWEAVDSMLPKPKQKIKVIGKGGQGCVVAPSWSCATQKWQPLDDKHVSKFASILPPFVERDFLAARVLGMYPDKYITVDPELSCELKAPLPKLPSKSCSMVSLAGDKDHSDEIPYHFVMRRFVGVALNAWNNYALIKMEMLFAGLQRLLSLYGHLHDNGYIHGDAFFRNIMLPPPDNLAELVLIDFSFFFDTNNIPAGNEHSMWNAEYTLLPFPHDDFLKLVHLRDFASRWIENDMDTRVVYHNLQRLGGYGELERFVRVYTDYFNAVPTAPRAFKLAVESLSMRSMENVAKKWWCDNVPAGRRELESKGSIDAVDFITDVINGSTLEELGMASRKNGFIVSETAHVAVMGICLIIQFWMYHYGTMRKSEVSRLQQALSILRKGCHPIWKVRENHGVSEMARAIAAIPTE